MELVNHCEELSEKILVGASTPYRSIRVREQKLTLTKESVAEVCRKNQKLGNRQKSSYSSSHFWQERNTGWAGFPVSYRYFDGVYRMSVVSKLKETRVRFVGSFRGSFVRDEKI